MIYEPAEDSFLMEEQVKKFAKGKTFLDVGTGSGILALTAKEAGAKEVLAIDINSEAVKQAKSLGINSEKSNLLRKVNKKFDIICFNPPYLPLDEREDKESRLITTGGKEGDEIILEFLKQAKTKLSKEGFILLLVSSLTPKKRIYSLVKSLNLKKRKLSSKKIFMESLEVWKLKAKL